MPVLKQRIFISFRMSTRVLLATLSIPITPERTDIARLLDMDGIIVEKQRRLATLLGLQAPPTRIGLINDMVGIHLNFIFLGCLFWGGIAIAGSAQELLLDLCSRIALLVLWASIQSRGQIL